MVCCPGPYQGEQPATNYTNWANWEFQKHRPVWRMAKVGKPVPHRAQTGALAVASVSSGSRAWGDSLSALNGIWGHDHPEPDVPIPVVGVGPIADGTADVPPIVDKRPAAHHPAVVGPWTLQAAVCL